LNYLGKMKNVIWSGRLGSAAFAGCRIAALLAPMGLLACSPVALQPGGTLSTYDNLGTETGILGKSRAYADAQGVAQARTVRLMPTVLAFAAAGRLENARDRRLVAKALDRALCIALSDKYEIVPIGQPADLTLHNIVTDIVPTGRVAAGASVAITVGSSFVLPGGVPRMPIGLGGIAVEGEAVDRAGRQLAAILWARGANSIRNSPRVSQIGDAYSLATAYGDDFSQLILTGETPSTFSLKMPTQQRIVSFFGGKPKYEACEVFVRAPGLPGLVDGAVGAPPEWTDPAGDSEKTSAGL
jgi:hypothetical protein